MQKQTRRVSQTIGRQRNNIQMKGKEESSQKMLNEIQASQLSDIEFKTMVLMSSVKIIENYREVTRN